MVKGGSTPPVGIAHHIIPLGKENFKHEFHYTSCYWYCSWRWNRYPNYSWLAKYYQQANNCNLL